MTLPEVFAALTVLVNFSWDAVPDPSVTGYQVGCGPQPDKYNSQTFWTMDHGPPLATNITVEVRLNRTWYCAVRSYGAGTFSDYSNGVELVPTFAVRRLP